MADVAATPAALAPAPAPATDPRRTILEVEAFVAGATTLLVLQLICGLWRRRSSSIWINGAVWLAYTLSFPLVTYTFGLMQSSPAKSELYPVWAISLFLVAGCSNSVTACDLDETKKWKTQLFELGQQYVYSGVIFLLLSPSHLSVLDEFLWTPQKFGPILEYCYALLAIITITNSFRVIACWMATFSDPSKVVADYMRDKVDTDLGGAHAHQLLQPQEYLVWWYGYFLNTHGGAKGHSDSYTSRPQHEEDFITLGNIWDECGGDTLLFGTDGSQSKDVCLSFALFHLLKRRYFGINCYEAGLPETRDFVLNWLLASEDDGKRAFRVIEAELAFLHDFFFTKYASIYGNDILFFVMSIMKAILIVILGVFVAHQDFLRIKTQSPIIPVKTMKVDTMITLAVLGALLLVEILQTMLYLASDWALVSLACYYVRRGLPCRSFIYSLLRRPIHVLRKASLFFFKYYWQNKIGQYSVIEGSRWHKLPPPVHQRNKPDMLLFFIVEKIQMLVTEVAWKILTCQYCNSVTADAKLPDNVKSEIVASLKSIAYGPLTNGATSLRRNGVLSQFEETLKREDWDLAETMLIWHVATSYCETDQNSGGHGELRCREVATSLSRYSAYLMVSVPELLPGNPIDTSFTFDKVIQEATEALYPGQEEDTRGRARADCRDMLTSAFNRLRSSDQENHNGTIFFRGLKLGRELEEHVPDKDLRWKVMAEFWAEIILYVAPSDNVRGHVEKLANGGEFITHVWALLSHAGILTRNPRQQELSQTPS